MNQREIALNILYKTIHDSSYSNLLMREELKKLPVIQRSFCTNLVNSVLRKYDELNYQFMEHINKSTSLKTRLILCMAMYERFYMNEKDYAVNNEYVSLGSSKYEKSFINAVLHKVNEYQIPDEDNEKVNLPKWIYGLLKAQYSKEDLNRITDIFQSVPVVYYRLNKRKCKKETLNTLDVEWINDEVFKSDRNMLNTTLYKDGYFYVQDYNSSQLYKNLDLNEDDVFIDICSAPGSKLFNALDMVKPENAYANDVHEKRVDLIRKMATRLGFEGVHYSVSDGRLLKDKLCVSFDKILLDAPCSGLGVIARKPDLKFHIKPENLDELQTLQYELLCSVKEMLKDGGIMLYSTCTLNRKENDKQISRFIKEFPYMKLEKEETIINDMGDCFYYAKLRKDTL